jgi:hypothetical protein
MARTTAERIASIERAIEQLKGGATASMLEAQLRQLKGDDSQVGYWAGDTYVEPAPAVDTTAGRVYETAGRTYR